MHRISDAFYNLFKFAIIVYNFGGVEFGDNDELDPRKDAAFFFFSSYECSCVSDFFLLRPHRVLKFDSSHESVPTAGCDDTDTAGGVMLALREDPLKTVGQPSLAEECYLCH